MNLFEQLGKEAADNFIKQAGDASAQSTGGIGSFFNMFKKTPPATPQKPKPPTAAEEYANYQNQRMSDSARKLPYDYMGGVRKDFADKEKAKITQEFKTTPLERASSGLKSLIAPPPPRTLHEAVFGRLRF